jgi:transposase
MSNDDVLFRFRLRVIALARELGSVREACRMMEVHPSSYYRWRKLLERYGPDMLRPRERRRPQMPNAISHQIEQKVLAFALAHPSFGPHRIALELKHERWGGIAISGNGVWRVLRRHGLQHRRMRLALVAGVMAPPEPPRPSPPPERHLQVDHPGELVQMDCFYIGRLSGTKGTVWQYSATDVFSAYTWAELRVTPKNPSARWTSGVPPIRWRPDDLGQQPREEVSRCQGGSMRRIRPSSRRRRFAWFGKAVARSATWLRVWG